MVKDKVVFVTGAAQGIGFKIAEAFAKEGAKIALTDLNLKKVQEAANNLSDRGFEVIGIACDVSKEHEIIEAINQTKIHYGSLEILINNAGLQHVSMIEDFPTEKFQQLIQVMLVGSFMTIKHALPIMKENRFGRIINIASINGLIGFAGKAAYNSAKHGVIGLTKVAALETAEYGITVNALCPGYVDTPLVRGQFMDLAETRNISVEKVLDEVLYPLIPQKRLLDVSEIADYALFLASEKAKGVTGQAVVLDGGYTAQ
ncbi:3-hydroxybutyrate dehydrogenase [Lysinibacillus telephonicus]|uniref:3-hydroxybutyrate dehydrogenase n=1 Tax=Lysinibacillus telephonicus TaxID=1714840 RepID=A0A431UUG1_9BACI|nr:3-hydroxybutyrate dehydrogenase [Lysinibacillus telephonicus]RTQ94125.1 3-hydroxybutyrate dehydrogenase [Lysinibacillus telephonicus]